MHVHQGQRRQPRLHWAMLTLLYMCSRLRALALLWHSQLVAGVVQQIFTRTYRFLRQFNLMLRSHSGQKMKTVHFNWFSFIPQTKHWANQDTITTVSFWNDLLSFESPVFNKRTFVARGGWGGEGAVRTHPSHQLIRSVVFRLIPSTADLPLTWLWGCLLRLSKSYHKQSLPRLH